ncbi:MAG TPA: sulfite exporter TauE/SafE family protein [Treponemataceae bacterium]|nr:sulfite exporter TauE/SafE family protein [Treponemataceae bacterium]HQL32606.1 sulfite exporter TauE/SafE family protein [Treponemataceae bacterium]
MPFSAAEPLALGFSTGSFCVMYCAPVLLPFLLGREGSTHRRNAALTGLFLAGRLAAYAAVGAALAAAGMLAMEFFDPVFSRRLSTVAYTFCGLALLAHGFAPRLLAKKCGAAIQGAGSNGAAGKTSPSCATPSDRILRFAGNDFVLALFAGLCVGLHICPPLWTACFRAASSGLPAYGVLYFALFYAGTLPFFLPLAGIPFLPKKLVFFRKMARMTQILVGAYFFLLAGLIPFAFGR